jgi:hypothetical protein
MEYICKKKKCPRTINWQIIYSLQMILKCFELKWNEMFFRKNKSNMDIWINFRNLSFKEKHLNSWRTKVIYNSIM